jgi:hypothetical protein
MLIEQEAWMEALSEVGIHTAAVLLAMWCTIERLRTTRSRWTEQVWWAIVAVIVLGLALFTRAFPELVIDMMEIPIGILSLLALPVFWTEFWKYLMIDVDDSRRQEELGQKPAVPKWRQILYLAVRLLGMMTTLAGLALFIWPAV